MIIGSTQTVDGYFFPKEMFPGQKLDVEIITESGGVTLPIYSLQEQFRNLIIITRELYPFRFTSFN